MRRIACIAAAAALSLLVILAAPVLTAGLIMVFADRQLGTVFFDPTRGGVAIHNVDGSFYDLRALQYDGTSTRVLCEPPDDWGGRAAIEWARRLGDGARFEQAAEEYVAVHETLDRIYGRAP